MIRLGICLVRVSELQCKQHFAYTVSHANPKFENLNNKAPGILSYNVRVVGVLLPPLPPRLGGVELAQERARLLLPLPCPELRHLDVPAIHRRGSPGVAAIILWKRQLKMNLIKCYWALDDEG